MVGLQGQKVDVLLHDALRLSQHLSLGNPKGGGGNGNCEVVDLDAIELLYAHLDGIHKSSHHRLTMIFCADDIIFQTTQ